MFSSITEKFNQTFNISLYDNNDNKNNNNNDYSECKFIQKFKKQKLENRLKMHYDIFLKYPDRIPMIVDTKKEIVLNKNKFIVPKDLIVSQFVYMLKKRIQLNASDTIYLLCNNKLLVSTNTVSQIYSENKETDGFLYIVIAMENTFGNNN